VKSFCLIAAVVGVAVLALPAGAAAPPRKEVVRLKRQVSALQKKVDRLEEENKLLSRVHVSAFRRERALVRHVAEVDPCPITHPNGSSPPGSTFGAEFHGNGAIWVGMWPSNVVVTEPNPTGAIDAKFGWWRAVRGNLRIEGRRLDGPAPLLSARVPDGYGDEGFQSSAIVFPTGGCWEVTGRVGGASLTFVTLVLAARA
jgi:hypothetical protein